VRVTELFDYGQFAEEGSGYVLAFSGEEVGSIQLKHSNIGQEVIHAREFKKKINPDIRIPTLEDISDFLKNGYLLICNINCCALDGEPGFTGHSVVVKGVEDGTVILHDPGLPPIANRKVSFEKFKRAWASPDKTAQNVMAVKLK
jgi:hypothetical protein